MRFSVEAPGTQWRTLNWDNATQAQFLQGVQQILGPQNDVRGKYNPISPLQERPSLDLMNGR